MQSEKGSKHNVSNINDLSRILSNSMTDTPNSGISSEMTYTLNIYQDLEGTNPFQIELFEYASKRFLIKEKEGYSLLKQNIEQWMNLNSPISEDEYKYWISARKFHSFSRFDSNTFPDLVNIKAHKRDSEIDESKASKLHNSDFSK